MESELLPRIDRLETEFIRLRQAYSRAPNRETMWMLKQLRDQWVVLKHEQTLKEMR